MSDLSDSFSKTELKLETGSNISSHFKPCYSCGVGMGRKHGETMKSVLMFSNLSVYYNHMGSFFKTQIVRPHASRIGWPHSFCTGRTAKWTILVYSCLIPGILPPFYGTSANSRGRAKYLEGNRNGKKHSALYLFKVTA